MTLWRFYVSPSKVPELLQGDDRLLSLEAADPLIGEWILWKFSSSVWQPCLPRSRRTQYGGVGPMTLHKSARAITWTFQEMEGNVISDVMTWCSGGFSPERHLRTFPFFPGTFTPGFYSTSQPPWIPWMPQSSCFCLVLFVSCDNCPENELDVDYTLKYPDLERVS